MLGLGRRFPPSGRQSNNVCARLPATLFVVWSAAVAGGNGQPGHEHKGPPVLAKFADIHTEGAFPANCSDQHPGVIRYTLLEPARVRVRVQARNTRELYLRTIVDWGVRAKGPHTETWKCRDNSGHLIDLLKASIRMLGEPMSTYHPGAMHLEQLTPEEVIHGHKYGHSHNSHHEWACREVRLKIISPGEGERMSGRFSVRSAVDKKTRGYGDTYGYGVRYYIDTALINEEFYKPESSGNFAYEVDTTAFPDGEHMLHLGLCDHNDHGTSASVKVVIDNSGGEGQLRKENKP